MPRVCQPSPQLANTLRHQDGVSTLQQLVEGGYSRRAVDNRVQRGLWRRLLPQVICTTPAAPTPRQLVVAAWLWAGSDSAIDGVSACRWYGLRFDQLSTALVHVVVPATSPVRSRQFVVVRRAAAEIRIGARARVPYVDVSTAALVAARQGTTSAAAVAVLSRALQSGLVTSQSLAEARELIGDKWCRRVDEALRTVGIGVRSPLERDNRNLILKSTVLPEPLWNQWLDLGDRAGLVCADALWPDAGLIEEVLGKRYHAWGEQFDATEARRSRLVAAGLVVQGATAAQIRGSGPLLRRLEQTYVRHAGRGLPAGVRLVAAPAIAR